jgi:hypothetical protein
LRRLAAITVATSLLVWWPAFTLGLYKAIFFEQFFALWAAATAAFCVAVLLLGRRAQPAVYSLLLPSVWILLTWAIPADTTTLGHDVLFWVGVVVTLAGFPAMVATSSPWSFRAWSLYVADATQSWQSELSRPSSFCPSSWAPSTATY